MGINTDRPLHFSFAQSGDISEALRGTDEKSRDRTVFKMGGKDIQVHLSKQTCDISI